jgi:hypothetical protein
LEEASIEDDRLPTALALVEYFCSYFDLNSELIFIISSLSGTIVLIIFISGDLGYWVALAMLGDSG